MLLHNFGAGTLSRARITFSPATPRGTPCAGTAAVSVSDRRRATGACINHSPPSGCCDHKRRACVRLRVLLYCASGAEPAFTITQQTHRTFLASVTLFDIYCDTEDVSPPEVFRALSARLNSDAGLFLHAGGRSCHYEQPPLQSRCL